MQRPVKVVGGWCERVWGVSNRTNSTDKGSLTVPRGHKKGDWGAPHLSLLHDPVFEEFYVNT